MKNSNYRKYNDRTCNSSTYHKKDGTSVRAKLKKETNKEITMSAISGRAPAIEIEYDCRGKRKRAHFQNSAIGARAFYAKKLKAGRNPKVCSPRQVEFCVVCDKLFPVVAMIERPPAQGLFCPKCAKANSVPGRIY